MKAVRELEKIEREAKKKAELEARLGEAAKYFDDHGRFIPKLLADEIMSEYHFITMMDNEVIYVYIDGFYQPYGEVLIKKLCKDRLQDEYRRNRASEVIDYIKASTYVWRHEEPPNLIPLANGVLDLDTMELKPHSPAYMFFNKLPVKYDPEAKCPNIDKFHREIVGSEEDVRLLEEVIGFCLYRDYFIAKALMLVGGGANAKSTWLNLVKTFLGFENVSSRGLQELEENRFAKADLHHKLANIYADLPDKALYRTGTFKMLTGRDPLTAERKFQNSFQFVNYAKLLFSANKVPEVYEDTDAFFRRWIIIVFPHQFIGDDADPNILEKLTTEEELSGLLNKALEALRRLLKNGRFSHSKSTEEIREDYIRKSSPIAAFIMDCLEIDSDAFIIKKDLYSLFAEYCRIRKIPSVTRDTFFKNLPQHIAVTDFRPKIEGKRPPVFKGIRLNLSVSTLFKENSGKEAENGLVSTVSALSRGFYTLIEKRAEYEQLGYLVEELPNEENYIKIRIPLDTVDRADTGEKKGDFPKGRQKTLDIGEKPKEKGHKELGEKKDGKEQKEQLEKQKITAASKFKLEEAVGCRYIKNRYVGVCGCCGERRDLVAVVTTFTGKYFVCKDCAEMINKHLKEIHTETEEKHPKNQTFELGALQDKIRAVREILGNMERDKGVAKREELIVRLEKELGIPRDESERIIGMLIREGTIYEPRSGYLKKT